MTIANPYSDETIWRKERLHKGIFCLPALLFLIPLIPVTLAIFGIYFLYHKTNEAFQQLQPQPQPVVGGLLFVVVVLLLMPWLIACLISFLATLLSYLKSEITLTNRRLLFQTGFVMRVSGDLPLENIESIFIIEPLIGRLCGYGTVAVTSVGGRAFSLRFIGSPQTFHATLQSAVAKAKTQRTEIKPPALSQPPQDDSRFMPKQ